MNKPTNKTVKFLLMAMFAIVAFTTMPIATEQVVDVQITPQAHAAVSEQQVRDYCAEVFDLEGGYNLIVCEPKPNTIANWRITLAPIPSGTYVNYTINVVGTSIMGHTLGW